MWFRFAAQPRRHAINFNTCLVINWVLSSSLPASSPPTRSPGLYRPAVTNFLIGPWDCNSVSHWSTGRPPVPPTRSPGLYRPAVTNILIGPCGCDSISYWSKGRPQFTHPNFTGNQIICNANQVFSPKKSHKLIRCTQCDTKRYTVPTKLE